MEIRTKAWFQKSTSAAQQREEALGVRSLQDNHVGAGNVTGIPDFFQKISLGGCN